MKKIALSAVVIAASGAYVWSQVGAGTGTNVAAHEVPAAMPQTASPAAPSPAATVIAQAPADDPAQKASVRLASARSPAASGDPIHAAWVASHMHAFGMGFSDGTYRGPAVDALYGVVQVEAIIKHGRLDSIKVLRWPADRSASVVINEQALPRLRDEAISAQSADVDIVSGATLVSDAFIKSLRSALGKARA